jgi:hypothetical protein
MIRVMDVQPPSSEISTNLAPAEILSGDDNLLAEELFRIE